MPSSSKTMRIGMFGGAFDPPHRGHERALDAFLREADLDLCLVIPSGKPPHKAISSGADNESRLAMTCLAFQPLSEKVRVWEKEMETKETTYTYQTVAMVKDEFPGAEIFLFVGTDQFLSFYTWKEYEKLLGDVTLCVMERYAGDGEIEAKSEEMKKDFNARLLILKEKAYIISSTRIREELKEKGYSPALSPQVNDYIATFGLYRIPTTKNREQLVRKLRAELTPQRLSHTLAVEREVAEMCKLFSVSDPESLRLAALCHDRTKEMTLDEHQAILSDAGETAGKEDLECPAILHAASAACLSSQENILPPEAISAIRYHSTGRAGMSLEEKILYLADYIEQTRPYPYCKEARRLFYEKMPEKENERLLWLDTVLLSVMKESLAHLKRKKKTIHPLTLEAVADLMDRKENQ